MLDIISYDFTSLFVNFLIDVFFFDFVDEFLGVVGV